MLGTNMYVCKETLTNLDSASRYVCACVSVCVFVCMTFFATGMTIGVGNISIIS